MSAPWINTDRGMKEGYGCVGEWEGRWKAVCVTERNGRMNGGYVGKREECAMV